MYKQLSLKFKGNDRTILTIKNHIDLISLYREESLQSSTEKVMLNNLPEQLKAACWILHEGKFRYCLTSSLSSEEVTVVTSFKSEIFTSKILNILLVLGSIDVAALAIVSNSKSFHPSEAVESILIKMYNQIHPCDVVTFFSKEKKKEVERQKITKLVEKQKIESMLEKHKIVYK